MKRLFLILLLMFLIVPIVEAQSSWKLNTNRTISHAVRFNDGVVPSAICNVTITNPDDQDLVEFAPMVFNSTSQEHQYFLQGKLIDKFGEYCYEVTCTVSGFNKTESFCRTANNAGRELTSADSSLYIFILIISTAFLGLMIYGSFAIRWENNRNVIGELVSISFKKYSKIGCVVLAYLTFMWIAYIVYNLTLGFLEIQGVSKFFYFLFRTLLSFAYPLGAGFLIFLIINFILDLRVEKRIQDGTYFPKIKT